jgi:hypothetical protein
MCVRILLGYSHKQAKQKTEESGLLISRILLQQVWRIYCPQTRTLNITIVRDNTYLFFPWPQNVHELFGSGRPDPVLLIRGFGSVRNIWGSGALIPSPSTFCCGPSPKFKSSVPILHFKGSGNNPPKSSVWALGSTISLRTD